MTKPARRYIQGWCNALYTGPVRTFGDAHCKLPADHVSDSPHRTWRRFNGNSELLILHWELNDSDRKNGTPLEK